MKVTVDFGGVKVVVPCGSGNVTVRELIYQATLRYAKLINKPQHFLEVRSLQSLEGGLYDLDDCLATVLDDKDMLIANFEECPVKRYLEDVTSLPVSLSSLQDGRLVDEDDKNYHHRNGCQSPRSCYSGPEDSALVSGASIMPARGYHAQNREDVAISLHSHTRVLSISNDGRPLGIQVVPHYETLHTTRDWPVGLRVRSVDRRGKAACDQLLVAGDVITRVGDTDLCGIGGPLAQEIFRQALKAPQMNISVLTQDGLLCLDSCGMRDSRRPTESLECEEHIYSEPDFSAQDLVPIADSFAPHPNHVTNNSLHPLKHNPTREDSGRSGDLEPVILATHTLRPVQSVAPFLPHSTPSSGPPECTDQTGEESQKKSANFTESLELSEHLLTNETQLKPITDPPTGKKSTSRQLKINLSKDDENGLGFTVVTRDDITASNALCAVYIEEILPRGAAKRDGTLRAGDELVEVNGTEMRGMTQQEVVEFLRTIPVSGQAAILICRRENAIDENSDTTEQSDLSQAPVNLRDKDLLSKLRFRIKLNLSGSDGLGISIRGETVRLMPGGKLQDAGVFINAILPGGVAHKEGSLRANDRIVAVGGESLLELSNKEALVKLRDILVVTGKTAGEVSLIVLRFVGPIEPDSVNKGFSNFSALFSRHSHSSSSEETSANHKSANEISSFIKKIQPSKKLMVLKKPEGNHKAPLIRKFESCDCLLSDPTAPAEHGVASSLVPKFSSEECLMNVQQEMPKRSPDVNVRETFPTVTGCSNPSLVTDSFRFAVDKSFTPALSSPITNSSLSLIASSSVATPIIVSPPTVGLPVPPPSNKKRRLLKGLLKGPLAKPAAFIRKNHESKSTQQLRKNNLLVPSQCPTPPCSKENFKLHSHWNSSKSHSESSDSSNGKSSQSSKSSNCDVTKNFTNHPQCITSYSQQTKDSPAFIQPIISASPSHVLPNDGESISDRISRPLQSDAFRALLKPQLPASGQQATCSDDHREDDSDDLEVLRVNNPTTALGGFTAVDEMRHYTRSVTPTLRRTDYRTLSLDDLTIPRDHCTLQNPNSTQRPLPPPPPPRRSLTPKPFQREQDNHSFPHRTRPSLVLDLKDSFLI